MFSRTYSQGIRTVIRMLGNRIQKINQRKQLKIKAFYQTTRIENHYLIFLTFFFVVSCLMILHYQLNIINWLLIQYWSHLCDFLVVVVFAFFFCWTPFHSQRLMFVMVSKIETLKCLFIFLVLRIPDTNDWTPGHPLWNMESKFNKSSTRAFHNIRSFQFQLFIILGLFIINSSQYQAF